jgi:hypothetical protein
VRGRVPTPEILQRVQANRTPISQIAVIVKLLSKKCTITLQSSIMLRGMPKEDRKDSTHQDFDATNLKSECPQKGKMVGMEVRNAESASESVHQ